MTDFRAASQTRVSTELQAAEDKDSLGDQLERCLAAAQDWSWATVAEYRDASVSGAHIQRPELERMLASVKAGESDLLIIYKHDRLARTLAAQSEISDVLRAVSGQAHSVSALMEAQPPSEFYRSASITDLSASAGTRAGGPTSTPLHKEPS